MRVLILLDVGDLQRLILIAATVAMLLPLDQFDQRDVLGELCNIVAFEEDHDVVLWTLQSVLLLIFDEESIEATLAVGVAAGGEQPRHVISAILAVAQWTFKIAFHGD